MEKTGWKTTAVIFIVLFGVLILFTWNIMKSNTDSYNSQSKYYSDNYEYKCNDGTHKECIQDGKQCYQFNADTSSYPYVCNKGDYSSGCYDSKLQTSVVCNKLDGYEAICIKQGSATIKCPSGSWASCQGSNGQWVNSI